MTYLRVIPRDLFNEANLLKCYGKLYIETEGNPIARFVEEYVDSFDVIQREDDGFLYVENLPFLIGAVAYRLVRPLNSREAWPLYAERIDDPDADVVPVFDEQGHLSMAFLEVVHQGSHAPTP